MEWQCVLWTRALQHGNPQVGEGGAEMLGLCRIPQLPWVGVRGSACVAPGTGLQKCIAAPQEVHKASELP